MSGFAATIEIRSARPRWVVPLVLAGLLLAGLAILAADLPAGLRFALLTGLGTGAAYEVRRLRRGSMAPGVEALWLAPSGDWRLVLDTGELENAELLRRQGFVTRRLVGLTLRANGQGQSRKRNVRVWLTPSMLGEREWRLLQVRLRNP